MCKGRHVISNCPITSEQGKQSLRKAYRDNYKKSRDEDKTNSMVVELNDHRKKATNTTLFSALLKNCAIEGPVLADEGSDVILISTKIYLDMAQADSSLETITYDPAKTLNGARARENIVWKMAVRADIRLRVRH